MNALVHGSRNNEETLQGLAMLYAVLVYGCKLENKIPDSCGVTRGVVLKLVKGLEHKGHHLYCDNIYSSPALFSSLQQLGFGACGTCSLQ